MLPDLTKSYILDNVSQEDIFAAYFDVSLADIEYCISKGKLIGSAVRSVDERPSMGFTKRADGKIVCRDFGGYFWGDCFDAAAFALNADVKNSREFMLLLVHIAKTFRIHEYTDGHTFKNVIKTTTNYIPQGKISPVFEFKFRDWDVNDGKYWYNKYGITRAILEAHSVYAIQILWVNGKIVYTYRNTDPAYGYYLGQIGDLLIWKIYFPYRKEYRFMTNGSLIQGGKLLREVEHGVVIKSLKDVMQLAVFADTISLQGIAPASETMILNREQFTYVETYWKENIYTFSDFDLTGVRFGSEMRRRYKTRPLYLTNGRFNTINFQAKDISDYVSKFGLIQAEKLILQFIEVGENIIDDWDFIVNELKH